MPDDIENIPLDDWLEKSDQSDHTKEEKKTPVFFDDHTDYRVFDLSNEYNQIDQCSSAKSS